MNASPFTVSRGRPREHAHSLIADAQREVRTVYQGGLHGQSVSGAIWLASATAAELHTIRTGALLLIIGGAFIFPLTQLSLKLHGRRASLSPANPLRHLAMQIAFTVPLAIPVILGAAKANPNWFYPAFMIIVGAHCLPFAFLYGMRMFLALGALLIASAVAIVYAAPDSTTLGAWLTGALFMVFALLGRAAVAREEP